MFRNKLDFIFHNLLPRKCAKNSMELCLGVGVGWGWCGSAVVTNELILPNDLLFWQGATAWSVVKKIGKKKLEITGLTLIISPWTSGICPWCIRTCLKCSISPGMEVDETLYYASIFVFILLAFLASAHNICNPCLIKGRGQSVTLSQFDYHRLFAPFHP